MNPYECRSRAANREPGAMGIPYSGLGHITPVGTTHDTSLLYAATRGSQSNRICGGGIEHYCVHDLPRLDARHITSAVAAHTGW